MSEMVEQLKAAVGHFAVGAPDPRVDLPLVEQVERLIKWACSTRPENFRRCIPVEATDHDVLITWALGKMVRLVAEQEAELERLRSEL